MHDSIHAEATKGSLRFKLHVTTNDLRTTRDIHYDAYTIRANLRLRSPMVHQLSEGRIASFEEFSTPSHGSPRTAFKPFLSGLMPCCEHYVQWNLYLGCESQCRAGVVTLPAANPYGTSWINIRYSKIAYCSELIIWILSLDL